MYTQKHTLTHMLTHTCTQTHIPYCLKLWPISYKRRVSISGLGIARYNTIKLAMSSDFLKCTLLTFQP